MEKRILLLALTVALSISMISMTSKSEYPQRPKSDCNYVMADTMPTHSTNNTYSAGAAGKAGSPGTPGTPGHAGTPGTPGTPVHAATSRHREDVNDAGVSSNGENLKDTEKAVATGAMPGRVPSLSNPLVETSHPNSDIEDIVEDLLKDKLLDQVDNFSFRLDASALTINGVKQDENIYRKFRAKYIEHQKDVFEYSQYFTKHGSRTHTQVSIDHCGPLIDEK